jgi:hypothetical protein
MKSITDLLSRLNPLQIGLILFMAVAGILFVFGVLRLIFLAIKTMVQGILPKPPVYKPTNQFKGTVTRDEVDNVKDAVKSILLVSGLAIILACIFY